MLQRSQVERMMNLTSADLKEALWATGEQTDTSISYKFTAFVGLSSHGKFVYTTVCQAPHDEAVACTIHTSMDPATGKISAEF